ncbi:hypothetical protein B0J14DRAFT_672366, partial [Halenospora varia]
IIAFIVTAYLTLTYCIIKTILDHLRTRTKHKAQPYQDRLSHAFGNAVIILSDQQSLTGISIVIAAVSQLQNGLASYHWQCVVNLIYTAMKIFRIVLMGVLIVMLAVVMGTVGYLLSPNSVVPSALPAWCLYHSDFEWRTLDGELVRPVYNWLWISISLGFLIFVYLSRVATFFSHESI